MKPPIKITLAWEDCPSCDGTGMGLNMAGEPDACRECKGDTVIRARDEKGRYVGFSCDEPQP